MCYHSIHSRARGDDWSFEQDNVRSKVQVGDRLSMEVLRGSARQRQTVAAMEVRAYRNSTAQLPRHIVSLWARQLSVGFQGSAFRKCSDSPYCPASGGKAERSQTEIILTEGIWKDNKLL